MLPSHLVDSTKKRNEPLNHTRLGQQPPSSMMGMGMMGGGGGPSLCVTGAMCQQGRWIDPKRPTITLFYCIFRPRQLHNIEKPPLVVIHGGPSIPSNYLLPIVNGVTDRSIIFYDQWGCGKSSRPQQLLPKQSKLSKSSSEDSTNTNNDQDNNNNKFPMDIMIDQLHQLIQDEWKLSKYHLFGHSFGGILAYEYLLLHLKSHDDDCCCSSIILASTPTSASLIESESRRLYKEINQLDKEGNNDEYYYEDDVIQKQEYDETFRQTFECRVTQTPLALIDSLAQAGPTPWRGIQAIQSYDALTTTTRNSSSSNSSNKSNKDDDESEEKTYNNNNNIAAGNNNNDNVVKIENLPCLLLCGQYDFCTLKCIEGWNDIFINPKPIKVILTNCSHYGMLEDENQYGKSILEFLHQQEEK